MKKETKTKSKVQRVLAMLGVFFLIALYIITLVSAIITTPATKGLFMACVYSTIAIPVMLYAYMLVYRVLKKQNEKINEETNA